jgi:hypothetical protein
VTEKKTKAMMVTREELKKMVGPEHATGVVFNEVSPEDRRLFEKRVAEQGQPTKPNRAARRSTARLRQRAITKKKRRERS